MVPANRPAEIQYTPGSWLGVVRSGTVVLLRPDTDNALVEALWTLLTADPEIHEVLDAVTSRSGGSLARLPWFGIVGLRGSLQVFLRGEIDLDVRLEGGESVTLSGRDVTTWTERRFAAAEGFSVDIPAAAAAPAGLLPLGEGVVLLQGLRCGLTGTPSAAEVEPAAEPLESVPDAVPTAVPGAVPTAIPGAASEAAVEDQLLAAAEADIAAELGDLGSSADTVLELPEEDLDAGPETELPAAPPPEPAAPEPAEQEPAEQEPTGSYDHLWEQTVMRSIEDAAVREEPDAGEEPGTASPAEEPSGPEEPRPAAEPEAPAEEPAAAPAVQPATAPAVPTGLIDSVPWHTGGDRAVPAAPPAPRPAPGPAAPPSLFTAPPSTSPPSTQVPSTQGPAGDADHDGETIMKSDLGAAASAGSGQAAAAAKDPGTGPMVLARVCPQGHANPPTNAQCAYCGQALPGDGVQVRRPRLGRMRLSTGELIDLDQSLIVGRQPSVSRVQGAVMPKLVQVASPGGDISRSHVEVRLEGWHVMLCDLKATNGTVLLREGQAPRRLAQGEMAILFDGDIAELGDGIQLRFEELL